jgi:hypothetical protein
MRCIFPMWHVFRAIITGNLTFPSYVIRLHSKQVQNKLLVLVLGRKENIIATSWTEVVGSATFKHRLGLR